MKLKKKYTNLAVKHTEDLCNIPSPSGFTKFATNYLVKECNTMGFKPQMTRKSSVLVDIGGKGEIRFL